MYPRIRQKSTILLTPNKNAHNDLYSIFRLYSAMERKLLVKNTISLHEILQK